MNTQKIDFQDRIQQKHGLVGDCSIEFGNHSSDYFGIQQQPCNMRIRMQQPGMEAGGSYHQILGPVRPSSSILGRFESPALAFYATERCMGFSDRYDCRVGNPPCSQFSRNCNSEFPPCQFSRENFSAMSAEPGIELRNSPLQSIPKSDFCSNNNQYYGNPPSNNLLGSKLFPPDQIQLLASDSTQFSGPFEESQDHRVRNNSYGSSLSQMNYNCQQEKQSPRFSFSPGSSVSSGAVLSNKTRIRWTQDLHEKFVECVNHLGGAEKATPKAILKLMDSDGLTIFHVKSHLQKYRMAKYIPDSAEGKSEARNSSVNDNSSLNNLPQPQLDIKTGLQIKEALQIQLDVQMRLHEQLEIQRNLQLRIEEQGRQLKILFDQQQKTNSSQLKDQSSDRTTTPQDEPTFSLDDIEDSIAQNSGNTHFPSKIS